MFSLNRTAVVRVPRLNSRLEKVLKIKNVPTIIANWLKKHGKRVDRPQSSKKSSCGALLLPQLGGIRVIVHSHKFHFGDHGWGRGGY